MPPRKNAKKKAAPQAAILDEAQKQSIKHSISLAEEKLIESDAESAVTILTEALSIDPTNATILALLSEAHQMLGDLSSALEYLQASCQAEPNSNPDRFLALAQMLGGEEALQAVKKGIKMLERDLQSISQSDDQTKTQSVDEMKHTLSAAYIAAAELYTTDCCDLPEAQQECERSINQAIKLRPDSLEAHYAQGNLCLILGEDEKAKSCLNRCMEILNSMTDLGSMSALALVDDSTEAVDQSNDQSNNQSEDQTDELSDDETDDQLNNPPISDQTISQLADSSTYEVRMNVAKLAFELKQYDDALTVLSQLSEEDDRFIEVEHMFACALLLTDHVKDALEQAQHALEMVEQALSDDQSDDQAMEEDDAEYKKSLQITKRALQSVITECEQEIEKNPALAISDDEGDEDEDLSEDEDDDESDDEKRMDADE